MTEAARARVLSVDAFPPPSFAGTLRARIRRAVAPPPETPREAAARRVVNGVLVVAIAATLLLGGLERAENTASPGPPPIDLPIDVAHDPPWRLRLLPGLGPSRTGALVEDRARNGPVGDLEDLERIRGIGPKLVETLRAAGAVVERRGEGSEAGGDATR